MGAQRWYLHPDCPVLDGPEDTYPADLTAANDRRFAADRERWGLVQGALNDARDEISARPIRCRWTSGGFCPHPMKCHYGWECTARPVLHHQAETQDLVTIDHEAMDAYLAGLDNDPLYGAEE